MGGTVPLDEFLDDLLALLVAEPLLARVVDAVDPAQQTHQLVEAHADIADKQSMEGEGEG